MKRLLPPLIGLSVLLVAAASAHAAVGDHGASAYPRHDAIIRQASPQLVGPAMLRLIEDGTLTLSGSVQSFEGVGIPATVAWGSWTDDAAGNDNALDLPYAYHDYASGNVTTSGADGSFSFAGVTEQTNGALDAYFSDANGLLSYYRTWNHAFTGPDPLVFTLRPGRLGITSDRNGPGWSAWSRLRVVTFSSKGAAQSWVPEGGMASVMPDNLAEVDVYYWDNQGSVYRPGASLPVVPGEDAQAAAFTQSRAKRLLITKPFWASGKPGRIVTVGLQHWQAREVAAFYGQAEYPEAAPRKLYAARKGVKGFNVTASTSLTVPSTVVPGYAYQLHAYLAKGGGMLDLVNYFQVCTLKPSKSPISEGSAVKLSGIIPTRGHWGSKPGISKTVILYKRTTVPAGVPTAWDARTQGWKRVAAFRADGFGRFASAYLRPTRTTWYVLSYAGDTWYRKGYTSIAKVTVR